jgi:hypothetical protein
MRPPPSNSVVNRVVVLTLLLLVFSGTLGLGAVWVRQEIFSTANRVRVTQARIADVDRQLDEVTAGVATALSPATLLRRNETLRLGLAAPREEQVRRVEVSPELLLAAKRNREVFTVTNASFTGSAPVTFRLASSYR